MRNKDLQQATANDMIYTRSLLFGHYGMHLYIENISQNRRGDHSEEMNILFHFSFQCK